VLALIIDDYKSVELRQLAYFEAVARLGSFTGAAAELRVAQPAVSAQVRRLERELGAALLHRTTRQVRLTPAGELLLARARAALAEVDGARRDLADLADVARGPLRLGVTPMLSPVDVPVLLAGFHRRYPGVDLAVRSGLTAPLVAALLGGEVDALIAPVQPDLPARCQARRLAAERLVLATPPGLLPGGRPVSLAAVRDVPFVCLPPGSGLAAILASAAAAQGFTPRVQFKAPDRASIRRFVAAGLGVALLAEAATRGEGPAIDTHRLRPEPRHPPVGLIRDRDRPVTPVLRAWRQHLDRELAPRGRA
jgi:DNA-binding transcriptional LysR family regulator